MPLTLIGLGISFDPTLTGIEAIKTSDAIYWEGYTGLIPEDCMKDLETQLGRSFMQLKREQVESQFLIQEAAGANVALLVLGDPLTATTHISLVLDAKKAKIPVRIIHNSSIYTAAAGKAGLQIYRFGKTATLVNPRPKYKPISSFEILRQNQTNNLHTLILLDTEPKFMEAKTALEMLDKADFNGKIVILSRLGFKDEKVVYGPLEKLNTADLGKPPFCLILPAKLHPMEEEFLNNL